MPIWNYYSVHGATRECFHKAKIPRGSSHTQGNGAVQNSLVSLTKWRFGWHIAGPNLSWLTCLYPLWAPWARFSAGVMWCNCIDFGSTLNSNSWGSDHLSNFKLGLGREAGNCCLWVWVQKLLYTFFSWALLLHTFVFVSKDPCKLQFYARSPDC